MIYKISDEEYFELARRVCGQLSSPCYFSGTVEMEGTSADAVLRLTASLIIYRRKAEPFTPNDEGDTIEHISAVWWDFICEDERGIVEDDFDFEKFSEAMMGA